MYNLAQLLSNGKLLNYIDLKPNNYFITDNVILNNMLNCVPLMFYSFNLYLSILI